MTAKSKDDKQDERVSMGNRLLVIVEDVIYVSLAALLAAGAVVLVVRAAIELFKGTLSGESSSLVEVLDTLLLVFIFVELLYAVRTTLKERQIVAEPFLIAGILASIKEIIVLSVTAAEDYIDKGPQFARAMVEIGLLAGVVILLAVTAVLLRAKESQPQENSNTTSADGRGENASG
jgi:uncharacterized membrane protein (DUF373 family)